MDDKELAKEIVRTVEELNKLVVIATERGIEVEMRTMSVRTMMHQVDNYQYLVVIKKVI